MAKQKLDNVETWDQVTDANGAMKLLALKVAKIAKIEAVECTFSRMFVYDGTAIIVRCDERVRELRNELIFYKDLRDAAVREYKVDCSAFDSAVRSLLPENYFTWNE